MEETKIVYGVKYYIKEVGTEFDIFETQQEADAFLENKTYDNIIPLKLVKGSVNKNAIFKDEHNELKYSDELMVFKSLEIIKTIF
ncbi:hypothetical protein [Flavobacterium ammonificans]|uniref:hypothetical protein n=1 Tax=Flavobacterium ammonificans TaxID=1751056 RepID=UPI001E41E692|nr:hypothetical protein [Flavobacterium ammonificans]BDB57062.1 hypothetical protein SHINM13_13580 [Flavobacterium ammonificans]